MRALRWAPLLALAVVAIPTLSPVTVEAAGPLAPPTAATGGPAPVAKVAAGHIKHVFVIVQEGHSFDNYFGTFPGVTGVNSRTAVPVSPKGLNAGAVFAHQITAVHTPPLDNSLRAAKAALNGTAMDGFVAAQDAAARQGSLAMGYYDQKTLPYYWRLAQDYVLADHFFSAALGGSTPNFQFLVAAQTWSAISGVGPTAQVPTIFNRLDGAGVSWGYFVATLHSHEAQGRLSDLESQVPLLSLRNVAGNPKDRARIQDISVLNRELVKGGLPQVSYVVRPGLSEHAPGNVAQGQVATAALINAIMRSRYWSSSAIFLTWSDWGGWYDSVRPPQLDSEGDGFRVPLLIVSPFAKRGYVLPTTADSTAILAFIEHLYGLRPLTSRDQAQPSLLGAFNFSRARAPAPVPMGAVPASKLVQGSVTVIILAYLIPVVAILIFFGLWIAIRRRRGRGETG